MITDKEGAYRIVPRLHRSLRSPQFDGALGRGRQAEYRRAARQPKVLPS